MREINVVRQMVRDIDAEIEQIHDMVRKDQSDENAKKRYHNIETDLRALAGMYAKVKIRYFGGEK